MTKRVNRRRMPRLISLFAGLSFGLLSSISSSVEIHKFEDPGLDRRFRLLTFEIRCLVCQNQNIADSDADLAKDLRNAVDRMLRGGRSDAEIKDFMVARYGEFVLYRPRLRAGTIALWVGPFALALAGLGFLFSQVRRTRTRAANSLTEQDRRRVEALLAADVRDREP